MYKNLHLLNVEQIWVLLVYVGMPAHFYLNSNNFMALSFEDL